MSNIATASSTSIVTVAQAADEILTLVFDLEKIGQCVTTQTISTYMERYDAIFLAELSVRFSGYNQYLIPLPEITFAFDEQPIIYGNPSPSLQSGCDSTFVDETNRVAQFTLQQLNDEETKMTNDIRALKLRRSAVRNKMLFHAERTYAAAAGILATMAATLHLQKLNK